MMELESRISIILSSISILLIILTSLITWYIIKRNNMKCPILGIELSSKIQHSSSNVYITAPNTLPIDLRIIITTPKNGELLNYTFPKTHWWGEEKPDNRYKSFPNPDGKISILVEVDAFYHFWFHQYELYDWDGTKWASRNIMGFYVDGWRKIFIPNSPLFNRAKRIKREWNKQRTTRNLPQSLDKSAKDCQ